MVVFEYCSHVLSVGSSVCHLLQLYNNAFLCCLLSLGVLHSKGAAKSSPEGFPDCSCPVAFGV